MSKNEFHWKSKTSGIKIYGKSWPIENPKAVLCLIHGLGEHVNRYDHMAKYYNQQGFAVVGYDRSGHGQSEGKKGHTEKFDFFLDEIDELYEQTKKQYPNQTLVAYGHSMGGQLVLLHAIKRKPPVKAIIATAPAIKLANDPPAALLAIGKLMLKVYPKFTQSNGLKVKDLSRDSAIVKTYVDDPLVHDRITSYTAITMLSEGDWLFDYKGKLDFPTLVMHGEKDEITSAKASEAFANRVGTSFKVWPGAYHEIHNEPEKETVYQYGIDWINQQL